MVTGWAFPGPSSGEARRDHAGPTQKGKRFLARWPC
jgi:hypothetical protein